MTDCPSSIKTKAQNPTQAHIEEFKSALRRGIRRGEQNAGIMCWMFFGTDAAAFIPTKWAYELMQSDEFKDLDTSIYWSPFATDGMEVRAVFTSKKINSTKKRQRQFSDFMEELCS